MAVLAEIRITPVGGDSSMRDEVARAVEALRDQGVECEVGPMGTTIEGSSVDEILQAVGAAHRAVRGESPRVVTTIVIDERLDKAESLRER